LDRWPERHIVLMQAELLRNSQNAGCRIGPAERIESMKIEIEIEKCGKGKWKDIFRGIRLHTFRDISFASMTEICERSLGNGVALGSAIPTKKRNYTTFYTEVVADNAGNAVEMITDLIREFSQPEEYTSKQRSQLKRRGYAPGMWEAI